MGYPVSKANSIQFQIGDERLAFAVVMDADIAMYTFGLFYWTPNGWNCPVFGNENGILDWNLTNEEIMAEGSVAKFITSRFPLMEAKLNRYLGAMIPKPAQENKPLCVGYDLALDVVFDPATKKFALNKEPPLSHAR